MSKEPTDASIDAMITPTPHEAYLRNLTPRVAESLLDAIKSQAMKDYINALSVIKYTPHDEQANKTIQECEGLFGDAGKLQTVRKKVKYDGGMFEVICMENFPESWGEMLPTKEDSLKCPICKEGRIGRFFRPVDPLKPRKKESKEPRIIYSCDVCTYKYVSYPKDWSDETLQKERDSLKRIALRQRQVLCSQEIREILKEHPEYKPEQIDEVYRKVAEKWHV